MLITASQVRHWRRMGTDEIKSLEGEYWTEAYIMRCGIRNMQLVGEGYGFQLPGKLDFVFYKETYGDIRKIDPLMAAILQLTETYKGHVKVALALHIILMQRIGVMVTDETVVVAPNECGKYTELRTRFAKLLF